MTARKRKKQSIILEILKRFFKPIISVAILTAFILIIAYTVKELAESNPKEFVRLTKPLFSKLNIEIDEEKVGEVAGEFVQRITNTDLSGGVSSYREQSGEESEKVLSDSESNGGSDGYSTDQNSSDGVSGKNETQDKKDSNLLFTVGILADVHSEYQNLQSAINILKEKQIDTVFFLGDYTELGLLNDLQEAKSIMDESGLTYYSIPGDHDLWKTVGPQNFLEVFEKNNHVVEIKGYKFVVLDNSANYTAIETEKMDWFKNEVKDADFVLVSQPLYHPSGNIVMGVVDGEVVVELREQAEELLKIIRDSNVKTVIAADRHQSSSHSDPEKSSLKHIVSGALTSERNIQTPRFMILNVYEDGGFSAEDVEL